MKLSAGIFLFTVNKCNRKENAIGILEVGFMFEKILVPVDGSETSWRALEEAKTLATAFNGELVVVNVIQPYNNSAMLIVPLDQSYHQPRQR